MYLSPENVSISLPLTTGIHFLKYGSIPVEVTVSIALVGALYFGTIYSKEKSSAFPNYKPSLMNAIFIFLCQTGVRSDGKSLIKKSKT